MYPSSSDVFMERGVNEHLDDRLARGKDLVTETRGLGGDRATESRQGVASGGSFGGQGRNSIALKMA